MTKAEKRDGDSKDRQNSADAEKFMNSICNIKYVSGITDIYEKYGELVNVVQKVHSFPHERIYPKE
jgi:hypothetical protein